MFKRGDVVEHVRGDRKETRTRAPYFAEIGTVVGLTEEDEVLVEFPSGTWSIEPRHLVLFDDRVDVEENPMKEPTETSDMDFTEADWEEAAAEARAAGHRVDKTERGYEFYPFGEGGSGSTPRFLKEYPSGVGPAMIYKPGTDDPGDLHRSSKMKRNPTDRRGREIACRSECIRPKGHAGECRRFPDRFYDGEGNLSEDVSQDELLAARKAHMQENPPRFREGDSVKFVANAAAMMLYTPGTHPRVGSVGVVTTVPVPGGRKTSMPGPRGGMVYVDWHDYGVAGVFAADLVREKTLPGCKASTDGLHHVNGADARYCSHCLQKVFKKNPDDGDVLIDDDELIKDLFDWHGGQGDPVYAVASSSNAGRAVPREVVEAAISSLNMLKKQISARNNRSGEAKHLQQVINRLETYL